MFFCLFVFILTITKNKLEIVLFLFEIMFVLPLETTLTQFINYTLIISFEDFNGALL